MKTFLQLLVGGAFLLATSCASAATNETVVVEEGSHSEECKAPPLSEKVQVAITMIEGYISSLSVKQLKERNLEKEIQQLFGHFSSDDIQVLLKEATELAEAKQKGITYADRFVQTMIDIATDPDCMQREFDVKAPGYDPKEATAVLRKCRVLVLRNAFDSHIVSDYRNRLTDYVRGVHVGRISPKGHTSNNEKNIVNDSGLKRWELMLPREMVMTKIIGNDNVMDVLMEEEILGDELTLHSYGMVMAAGGAPAQDWHMDEKALFGDFESVEAVGLGGYELPCHAINMMVPLLNVTHLHGPTEFCMGSNALAGLDIRDPSKLHFRNETLRKHLTNYVQFTNYHQSCPHGLWRSPRPNFGDAILFDYTINHRGGPNQMQELRAMAYMTFSRFWFKDGIFSDPREFGKRRRSPFMNQMLRSPRLAVPDGFNRTVLDEIRKDEKLDAPTKLQDFPGLFQGDPENDKKDDGSDEDFEKQYKFIMSNVDYDKDPVKLFVGEQVYNFQTGRSVAVAGKPGDLIRVVLEDGTVIKQWTVMVKQGQLMLTKANATGGKAKDDSSSKGFGAHAKEIVRNIVPQS